MSDTALAIAGEFSIYRAAELAQSLQEWLPRACAAGAAPLDLSGVTDMDSAGLQLLLATQRSAQLLGQPLYLSAASTAVQDTLALAGLRHLLPAAAPFQA